MTAGLFRTVALAVLFVFVAALDSVALEDMVRLESEITAYTSDNTIVSNARALLWDAVLASDTAKATRTLRYLDQRFSTGNVVAITPFERIALSYWTRDFETILNPAWWNRPFGDVKPDLGSAVRRWQAMLPVPSEEVVAPPRDRMRLEIVNKSTTSLETLQQNLNAASLAPDEQDFLRLLLKHLLRPDRSTGQKEVNALSKSFLEKHPSSPLGIVVKRYFQVEYERFAISGGGAIGFGHLGFTGNLADTFRDHPGAFLDLDINYLRLKTYFRGWFGLERRTRRAFEHDGQWRSELEVDSRIIEAAIGFAVVESRRLRVVPFAGVTELEMEPSPKEKKDKPGSNVEFKNSGPTVGLNIDVRGPERETHTYLTSRFVEPFLRVRLQYTDLDASRSDLDGGFYTATVGVGALWRPVARALDPSVLEP